MFIYKVQKGDSLSKIAAKFNINQINILSDNDLKAPYTLMVGQSLIIDTNKIEYIVKKNQDAFDIANELGISVDQIKKGNNISNLQEGQKLNIDLSITKYPSYVNGYSYQNLSKEVLNKYSNSLSTISPFSYRVKEDGSLEEFNISQTILDTEIPKVMVIANIKEKGGFSPNIAHEILSDKRKKSLLINNCVETMKKKNFQVLNIDFEYVNPEDKDLFTDFIVDMKAKLNESNRILSVALAPKTSSFQKGQLYEAHDYQKIGNVADYIILMTYEWGYTYGEPMAVSPLPQVKKVITYAKSVIQKEKILMGIPNYGYDWTLPYKKGRAAKSLSINEALDLAISEKVEIKHSKSSLTPYFNYVKDGSEHVVHFDDACSYKEKILLAIKEGIGGISIWTITSSNVQLSKLINSYLKVTLPKKTM